MSHISSASPKASPLATKERCGTKPLPPNMGRIYALSNFLQVRCTEDNAAFLHTVRNLLLELTILLFSSADVSLQRRGACVSELNESFGLDGSELSMNDLRCGGRILCTNGLVRNPKTFRSSGVQTKNRKLIK